MAWNLLYAPAGGTTGWQRPADWLPLPTVDVGDHKLVGLYPVFAEGSNFVALSATGAYTVDWGDGTAVENIATGVPAEHNFDYTALSSATLTSDGFRQAIITVTPQAGQTFTGVNLSRKHALANSTAPSSSWLDIKMAGSAVNSLIFYAATGRQRLLKQFEYVGPSSLTSTLSMFNECSSLESVVGSAWTSSVTNFNSMFINCYSLEVAPSLNLTSGTNFTSMFNTCPRLRVVPAYSTPAATTFATMFYNCGALKTIPAFTDTAAVTVFTSMFGYCYALDTIPVFDTSGGISFNLMFEGCQSLQSVPLLNTANGTNFTGMFNSCSSLKFVPSFNTAKGTTFTSMFTGCSSLQKVPALNVALGTVFTNMFNNCFMLASSSITGCAQSHGYTNCELSAEALDTIYTNLPTVSSKTITVTGNWGTATHTPSIATAKGWTVTS